MKTIKFLFVLLMIAPMTLQSQRRKSKITQPSIKLEDSFYRIKMEKYWSV